MGVFENRLLNVYFNDQYKLPPSNSNQNLFEKFFDLDFLKDIREDYSDIFELGLENLENLNDIKLQENLPQLKEALRQKPRLKTLVMDLIRASHENIPTMWKSFYFNDEFLHEHFSKMMESAKKVNRTQLMEIINDFQELRKSDLSLFQQIQSPLDINEVKTEARLKFKQGNFTIRDLDAEQWEIIQRLNQKEKNEQETNVHNWCHLVGELIESQLKRTIYFIYLINYLILTQEKYLSEKRLKSLSVSDVFKLYSNDYNKYLNNLRHIRNSANHSDFKWESSQQIETSLIHLIDQKWKKTITFEQLLMLYYKLVYFISTFELVVAETHLSILDNTRPLDLVWKDVGNQLFEQRKKVIKKWLEENGDNQNNL